MGSSISVSELVTAEKEVEPSIPVSEVVVPEREEPSVPVSETVSPEVDISS